LTIPHAAVLAALLSGAATVSTAFAQGCPGPHGGIPPGANTTDAAAPFFIATRGLNFATTPPTRDPTNPDYPPAKELPDGTLPEAGAEGNFIIGPTHAPAPEITARNDTPQGTVYAFTMSSHDGVIYSPGMIRDDPNDCLNASLLTARTAAGDRSDLLVTTSHPGNWTRAVDIYVPAQYVRGTEAPFIVVGDGGPSGFFNEKQLFTVLDNLIQAHRLPPLIAISIGAGGQDAQGSERGREYDTVSGAYAEWVEREVLPLVEQRANVKLTKDPDGRATMGISSSGAAAFTMSWFRPDLYHRVLAYSPTMVNQQWPHNSALPGGAWEYHSPWAGPAVPDLSVTGIHVTKSTMASVSPLIPGNPVKPIRFWFEVGDQDLFYPLPTLPDGMHDWVLADERLAKALAEKGYHYQFIFARNAKHVDKATVAQTLPAALEWVWKGYPAR
jgi:enterochelin esterase-like enzyme